MCCNLNTSFCELSDNEFNTLIENAEGLELAETEASHDYDDGLHIP